MQLFQELQRRNVVRVTVGYVISCWLLAQVADLALDNFGSPDWVMQTIILVLALGLPVVVFFSWAYEVTPEGLKRESEVDRSQSITHVTGRKLDRSIIAVLALALCYFAFDKYFVSEDVVQETPLETVSEEVVAEEAIVDIGKSIAVLPFVNMSGDESSTYFSDGLADTVLHMLAQVADLRVAARTSSFQFRDQAMDISEIGRKLNVSSVLEGSVQKSGDKIRVTAQLIDVSNGFHLWSGNFDRELDDVFRIQDEIATEVVAALKLSLLDQSSQPLEFEYTEDVGAYTEYLLAVESLASRNTVSLTKAVNHLQEAIRRDPAYAQAHAMLAQAYIALDGYGMMVSDQALPLARDAAHQALELSPGLVAAVSALAEVERRDGNLDDAEQLFQKAISDSPNDVNTLQYYASYLAQIFRGEEADDIRRRIIALDPLDEITYIALAGSLNFQRRYSEASEILSDLDSINPDNPSAVAMAAIIEHQQGNLATALVLLKRAFDLDPGDPELAMSVAWRYFELEMPEEASRWLDRTVEIDPQHPVSLTAPLWLDFFLRRNPVDSFRLANELLNDGIDNQDISSSIAEFMLIEHGIRTDQLDVVLDTLEVVYPIFFEDPPQGLDNLNYRSAMFDIGWALMASGDTERGSVILQGVRKLEEGLRDTSDMTRLTAIWTELLLGDKDRAKSLLAGFEKVKYYSPLNHAFFEHSILFDPLRDDPQFKAILNDYRENAAEQRKLLQAMNE